MNETVTAIDPEQFSTLATAAHNAQQISVVELGLSILLTCLVAFLVGYLVTKK